MSAASDQTRVTIGPLTVDLSDATHPDFRVKHNLSELFGMEFNNEAEEKLRLALNASAQPPGEIDLDHESDFVFVTCRKPESMVFAVRTILDLSSKPPNDQVSEADLVHLLNVLKEWRRPQTKKWGAGDVFAVPLKDGGFAFGAVLHGPRPLICALYSLRASTPQISAGQILKTRVISILNTTPDYLNSGAWPILAMASGAILRCFRIMRGVIAALVIGEGTTNGSGILVNFLHAYHGLEPWNVMHDEKYFDKLLRLWGGRPKTARILGSRGKGRVPQSPGLGCEACCFAGVTAESPAIRDSVPRGSCSGSG